LSRLQRVPGLGWYALAGAIFVGALAIAVLLVWRFVVALEPSARFLAPGSFAVAVALPGDHLLWHEHRTIYDGRTYDIAPAMPEGTRYDVQAPDGQRLAVEPYSGMSSEGSAGSSVSVARFDAPIAGVYRVAVEGSFEPRVMAVGPNRAWPIVKLAGELSVLIIGALGLAVAVGLYGFLRTVEPPIGATQGGAAHGAEPEVPVRKLAGLVYGLQAASMLVGVTLFAAVVINYLRRSQAAGTWLESHFTWQIRTFWWSLAWCVLGVATAVLLVGLLILAASAVWFVYRVVRGWTELNEGRPMYA
jgi:uncharacterized membrane protein